MTDAYNPLTFDDLNNAPDDSYIGHERDLADLVDDPTLEAIETALETDEFAAYTLFILLMMNPVAAENMTYEDPTDLIRHCQDDARDDSSEAFQVRLAQRMAARKTLRDLTASYRRHTEENDHA
jgi:hypothetical protein